MGWTGTHRAKGEATHKEWFTRDLSGENYEVLDVAGGSINRNHVYAAVRRIDKDYVFGVAILTQWRPKDYYNFYQKEMDESMGPSISDMPERIYKLLSPLDAIYGPDADYEADGSARWAKEWRERVEAHHKRMRNRVKLENGLAVKAPYDLNFGSWNIEAGEVFVVTDAKRKHFARNANGYSFRLRKDTLYDLEYA